MIEIPLRLAKIVKSNLVDRRRADRPGVAQIPLLRARLEDCPETGERSSGSLKNGKRIGPAIVIEIIVGGELLYTGDAVVESDCELIGLLASIWARYELVVGRIAQCFEWRHVVLKYAESGRIKTLSRDLTVRENRRIGLRCGAACG